MGKEKNWCWPSDFLICRFFLPNGIRSDCFIRMLHSTSTTPPPMPIVPPLRPSRCLFFHSHHCSSSLMTELLAGDMKAAFPRLISTLNSQEKDGLSKMLNWTLDLSPLKLTVTSSLHIPPATCFFFQLLYCQLYFCSDLLQLYWKPDIDHPVSSVLSTSVMMLLRPWP